MACRVPGRRSSRTFFSAVRGWLGSRGCCTSSVQPNREGQDDFDFTSCTSKQYRWHKSQVLRQNRSDPALELKARLKKLHVPLEEVRRCWLGARGRGLHQLQTSGTHCHIYQDVFGCEFHPQGFLSVSYSDCYTVSWGNLIPAKDTRDPPRVTLLSQHLPSGYASLVLTNPDGHLLDNTCEVLHWMIVNVPVSDSGRGNVEEGSVVSPYLPPVPPQGTGFHRYVFALYTHATPLSLSTEDHAHSDEAGGGSVGEGWLHQRKFSSAEFLNTRHADASLKPWSFAFFQTQWDKSVSHTYKHILNYAEPVYGPERILGPRKTKQNKIYKVRQAKYTSL